MNRLLLVRHGATAGTRRSRFPATSGRARVEGCEGLDRLGVDQARALAASLPVADRCWSSFAERAVQTAAHAGAHPEPVAALAECDFGAWAGLELSEAQALDPDGLAAWHADPDRSPHGGEGLGAVRARARSVLAQAAALGGSIVAFTHGGLVKAALLEVLELPSAAVWRLECAPGSVTELRWGAAGWRVGMLNWTPTLRGAAQMATR